MLLVAVAVVRCHQAKREKVQISVSSNKQLAFIISLFHCRIGKFYASWTVTKHYENEWKNERTNGSNSIQEREYNLRIWKRMNYTKTKRGKKNDDESLQTKKMARKVCQETTIHDWV